MATLSEASVAPACQRLAEPCLTGVAWLYCYDYHGHMIKTTSVSSLKARLSAFLEIVRRGDEVLVTDRGRPIARLVPVTGAPSMKGRLEELIRSGRLRAPRAKLPKDFWSRKHPADPKGQGLAALLAERESGW